MNKKERSILKKYDVNYRIKKGKSIPVEWFGDAVFVYYYIKEKFFEYPLIHYDTEEGWEVLLNRNTPLTWGYHFMVEPMYGNSYLILHEHHLNNFFNDSYFERYELHGNNGVFTLNEVLMYQDELDLKWYDDIEKEGCEA